jgi:beta-mannosidase
VTSWSIVDHYLRPKLAYYAVKRELEPITVGMKRTITKIPANKYTRVDIKTVHKIEVWASNLTLQRYEGWEVIFGAWDIITGEQRSTKIERIKVTLEPNQSVEITEVEVPVDQENAEQEMQTVVEVYLHDPEGCHLAKSISWPEPLKYVHLQKPTKISIWKSPETEMDFMIASAVAVKGVYLSADDENVKFLDNCIDLMPGVPDCVRIEGLKPGEERMIKIQYLS